MPPDEDPGGLTHRRQVDLVGEPGGAACPQRRALATVPDLIAIVFPARLAQRVPIGRHLVDPPHGQVLRETTIQGAQQAGGIETPPEP